MLSPTITLRAKEPQYLLVKRMATYLRAHAKEVNGTVEERRIELHLPNLKGGTRAPQLVVEVKPDGGGTSLCGKFVAHPALWTASLFARGIALFALLIFSIYAYAQALTEQAPTSLWGLLPALLVLGFSTYCCNQTTRHGTSAAKELQEFFERMVKASQVDPNITRRYLKRIQRSQHALRVSHH